MTEQITVPRAAWDAMLEALDGLMRWQVRNVKVWSNPAYDIAHAALTAAKAAQQPAWRTGGGIPRFKPQAQGDARSLTLAKQQWESWKHYALELQERLLKYEGGAPMVLNAARPQASEPTVKESLTVPAGWKLVPVEPTPDMYDAARNHCAIYEFETAQEIYRAMLAAAPDAK